jgi:ABC-type transport system substrate-binding protein
MKIRLMLSWLLLLAMTACSNGIDNRRLRVDLIEDAPKALSIGYLPLPEASAYLRAATAQGLVAFDKQGRVIPALASRWIITDDGMSYIFRLNQAKWNDGRDVSSDDIAAILNTRIGELRGNRFGEELSVVDKAVAMTGKVIEIRLKAPAPNLLEIIAQPEFGLVFKGVGSGPMQAKTMGTAMRLRMREQNERGDWVLAKEIVDLRNQTAGAALARYKLGDTDTVSGGRFQHLPLLEAANLPGSNIQFDPVPGLFGLVFVDAGPFLSQQENREAIAMAIDRPKMLSSFGVLAWQETVTIAPEALQNRDPVPRPDWASNRIEDRKIVARNIIASWETRNGKVRRLRIGLPKGAGSRILFARLRSDMTAIGLDIEQVTVAQNPDLQLIDRVADMSSPIWYLNQLSCKYTKMCSEQADALAGQSRQTTDIAERQRLLGEAEAKLQQTRNFIPLANPVRWSVTRDGLIGFNPNPRGWHLLQYLGRDTI